MEKLLDNKFTIKTDVRMSLLKSKVQFSRCSRDNDITQPTHISLFSKLPHHIQMQSGDYEIKLRNP